MNEKKLKICVYWKKMKQMLLMTSKSRPTLKQESRWNKSHAQHCQHKQLTLPHIWLNMLITHHTPATILMGESNAKLNTIRYDLQSNITCYKIIIWNGLIT
jgi:hypothetical protein